MNSLRTNLIPKDVDQAMKISELFAKSDIVPDSYKNKPANIFVAVSAGASLGLGPFQAMQNIAVINGRPSVWGDALLAMVRNDKRCLSVKETIEGDGENKTATCIVSRLASDGSTEVIKGTFSMRQAKSANLLRRPTWISYPDRMLKMRARGFALRDAFADVIGGLITSEEAQDYPDEKEGDIKVVQSPKEVDVIDDIKNKVKSIEDSEKAIKYTMHFIGKKSPIVYANANDFVTKYMEVVAEIYNSEFTDEKKSQFMDELRTKNMATISSLNEILQSEMEIQMGEFNVSGKNTNDQKAE